MTMTIMVVMLMLPIASVRPQQLPLQNQHDISIAIEEMQRANYFSFVMLLNMVSSTNPRFLSNVTFLMPKDKMLARVLIHEDSVSDFLLRHSIPSPLLFEHLNLFPNGSIVPSSFPNYTLEILNCGRRNYHLNNVKIISRNICSLTSIKCHGIDSVLSPTSSPTNSNNNDDDADDYSNNNNNNSNDEYENNNSSSTVDNMSPPSPLSVPPVMAPSLSDDQKHPRKSESPELHGGKALNLIVALILGFVVGVLM